jgi:hypothetical protein
MSGNQVKRPSRRVTDNLPMYAESSDGDCETFEYDTDNDYLAERPEVESYPDPHDDDDEDEEICTTSAPIEKQPKSKRYS